MSRTARNTPFPSTREAVDAHNRRLDLDYLDWWMARGRNRGTTTTDTETDAPVTVFE